jgi:protein involved in polysaccharide export with SLBB domain
LKPGDELFIPRNDEEIRITGEVLFPTQSAFNERKNLKNYVAEAGGFTDNARKKKTYVLYPNGKAASTNHFLFFRRYPAIKPGSEIVVPKYIVKDRQRRSATENIALASALASLAYLVIAIIRL